MIATPQKALQIIKGFLCSPYLGVAINRPYILVVIVDKVVFHCFSDLLRPTVKGLWVKTEVRVLVEKGFGYYIGLFRALINCMALTRFSKEETTVPWVRPTAIVTWYYSIYAGVRAMLAAFGQPAADTHLTTARAYDSVLRPRMPHPLDMVAVHLKDEQYDIQLPSYPKTGSSKLSRNFQESRDTAKGMLLEYLSGSATWYVDRTKEQILNRTKLTSFRSKDARQERDRRLQKEIAFLHCAFRYRGKANYRDAIYLTYGSREPDAMIEFFNDMASTSRFFLILTLAFVEQHVGRDHVETFVGDARAHLRGVTSASDTEMFWANLYA